jgi:ferredoxin
MASVIPFKDHALARLRARLGAVEEANQDLIAFARGHSGAVSAIHEAVVAAIEADSVDDLLHVVTQEWPLILGIDAVALALIVGDKAFRADGNGIHEVEPQLLLRSIERVDGVSMRKVEHGHPLFGPACDLIRSVDACPTGALQVQTVGDRVVWELQYDKCTFCGICIEACPHDAIKASGHFELAVLNRNDLVSRQTGNRVELPEHKEVARIGA